MVQLCLSHSKDGKIKFFVSYLLLTNTLTHTRVVNYGCTDGHVELRAHLPVCMCVVGCEHGHTSVCVCVIDCSTSSRPGALACLHLFLSDSLSCLPSLCEGSTRMVLSPQKR